MLPNTMACTLTAVPQLSGMLCSLRYVMARAFIHEPNTAPIAPQSCARGSCGNGWPLSSPRQISGYHIDPVVGGKVGVEREAGATLVVLQNVLEVVMLDVEHHV